MLKSQLKPHVVESGNLHSYYHDRTSISKIQKRSLYEHTTTKNSPLRELQTVTQKTIQLADKHKLQLLSKQESHQFSKLAKKSARRKEQPSSKFVNLRKYMLQENLQIIRTLLDNYSFKYMRPDNYEKLFNTYGLKIESIKFTEKRQVTPNVQQLSLVNNTIELEKRPNKEAAKTMPKINKKINKKAKFHEIVSTENRTLTPFVNVTKEAMSTTNFVGTADRKQRFSKLDKIDKIVENSQKLQKIDKSKERQKLDRSEKMDKIQKLMNKTDIVLLKHFRYGSDDPDNFALRLKKYRQFLFIVNMSNNLYRTLQINEYPNGIKYFVGKGNNSNLVKSILKKRFWFVETEKVQQANLIWTQIKVESMFKKQNCNTENCRLDNIQNLNTPVLNINANIVKKGVKQFQPADPLLKILNQADFVAYKKFLEMPQKKKKSNLDIRSKLYTKPLKQISIQEISKQTIQNHLPSNGLLGNKKAMFYSLRQYCQLTSKSLFEIVPYTFHIQRGTKDIQFKRFLAAYTSNKKQNKPNIWIVKPGQFTNRGQGIKCTNKLEEIKKILQSNDNHTYILQKYLTRPCLYNQRKFDIRAYMLITSVNGIIKGYWYQEGYVRTASYRFSLDELQDPMIHLTNDAVQKNCEEYGRYQQGNKLSYNDLQRYLENTSKLDFFAVTYPQMKKIAIDAIRATCLFIDDKKKENNFEIFGLDFMMDQKLKPWLLEINTNPCLETSSGVLSRIIPHMLENAFRISVDATFPPPDNFTSLQKYHISQNSLLYNKFELVYDEVRDGNSLAQLYSDSKVRQDLLGKTEEDQEVYQDEGEQVNITEEN